MISNRKLALLIATLDLRLNCSSIKKYTPIMLFRPLKQWQATCFIKYSIWNEKSYLQKMYNYVLYFYFYQNRSKYISKLIVSQHHELMREQGKPKGKSLLCSHKQQMCTVFICKKFTKNKIFVLNKHSLNTIFKF